jgi:hypothetical protein
VARQSDAHANFVPFGELFPFRGFVRKIYAGSSTGVTTTHGVIVLTDRPGRVKAVIDVDLPRPRTTAVLTSARFMSLKQRALELLRANERVNVVEPERSRFRVSA